MKMDYETLSIETIRAIRGTRSRRMWSRILGYRSNVVHAWEGGRRWPPASELFRSAARNGVDVRAAWADFFATAPPEWLPHLDPTTARGVAALLDEVRANTSFVELSRRTGLSRFAISRWLNGQGEPRLPDFFRLFEAASTRLLDLLSVIVDPYALPSVAETWGRLEARRNGAATHPWTQAILRVLEIDDYVSLPRHKRGWIAARLGIPEDEERRCIAFLRKTEQITWTGSHYEGRTLAVDVRSRPAVSRALKAHWTHEGAARIESGAQGQYSYLCFSVSRDDLERIREHHLRYFNTLRGIISESSPNEVVCVANIQLIPLEPSA